MNGNRGQVTGKVGVEIGTSMTIQIEDTGLICDGQILLTILNDCIQYVINVVESFGKMFVSE